MEGYDCKPDWSYWRRFEPNWKLEPKEWGWLTGGDVDVAISRGSGFILAAILGIGEAVMEVFWTGPSGVNYMRLAMALGFLILGGLLLRGKKAAALGLMVLYPAELITGHLTSYVRGDAYYVHHLGLWLCGGLFSLATWIFVFTAAYRAELHWAGTGKALPPDASIPPAGE